MHDKNQNISDTIKPNKEAGGWTSEKGIGSEVAFAYENGPIPTRFQYTIGRFVDIHADVNGQMQLVAKYRVLWSDEEMVGGVITNTYGYKRGKN